MTLTTLNTLTTPTTHYPHYTHYTHHILTCSLSSLGPVSRNFCSASISDLALHSSSTVGPDTTSEGQGEREQQGQGKHSVLVLELSCVNVIISQSTLQAYIMMTYT